MLKMYIHLLKHGTNSYFLKEIPSGPHDINIIPI